MNGEWISVDDRLPEAGQAVLFYSVYDDGLMLTGHMKHSQQWYENSRWERIVHVTHWMPLPEPPE